MAAAGAAAVPRQQEKEVEAVFAAKHAELLSGAREVGVTVLAIAFRPDGTAVAHELIGVGREERLRGEIARAVARDVSAMALRELAAHQMQLHALRAVVLRELQAKQAAADVAANNKGGDAVAKAKRKMEY